MRSFSVCRVLLLVASLSVAACDGDDDSGFAQCVEPAPGPPAGLCAEIALDFTMPDDVETDPTSLPVDEAQRMFDCLSWQTFIALNWPAKFDCRGVPDTAADFTTPDVERVWETYKETYEVFQSQNPDWNPADQEWRAPQPPVGCSSVANGRKILKLRAKTPFGRDVGDEIFQAFAGFGVLVDQAGNTAQYEVRFNRDQFEFLRDSGLAATGSYSYGGLPPSDGPVVFPDNRTGVTGQGAIEVKGAWKELTEADDASRYYAQEVVIFDATKDPECRTATMGLVGFHVSRKTYYAPQRAWMTFEHEDNTPPFGEDPDERQYSFYNASCEPPAPSNCWSLGTSIELADQVCCPNEEVSQTQFPGVPGQITRLDPVTDSELNARFRALLAAAGSPFQHYFLVATQWPRGGRSAEDPSVVVSRPCNPNGPWSINPPPPGAPCYEQVPDHLRNTTMESYMATFASGTVQLSSDSCMNCHAAAGVDFSYVWLEAQTVQVPIGQ